MDGHKDKKTDRASSPISQAPKVEFPDRPDKESFLVGTLPFYTPGTKKKQTTGVRTPGSYSPGQGSSGASTPVTRSAGASPVRRSPRNGSPARTRPLTGSPGAGSSLTSKTHSRIPKERPGRPHKKKKQFSGQIIPRDFSPARATGAQGGGYPVFDVRFVDVTDPSIPPDVLYELDSDGNFNSVPYDSELDSTDAVITDPPVFSGFAFSARDVSTALQCAQVQGIINRNPKRLRKPPGVKLLSHSWLVETYLKEQQQQHRVQDSRNSKNSLPKKK